MPFIYAGYFYGSETPSWTDIPLFENEALLKLLVDIGVGEEIPETLYLCIAQVIAFAYKIQGKFPEGWDPVTGTVND